MRCSSSPEACVSVCGECRRPSFGGARDAPAQLPAIGQWRCAGNRTRKIRVDCFLSSPSSTVTTPQLPTTTESLQDCDPRWLQEELIVRNSQLEVENGGLPTEWTRLRMTDGEPDAEKIVSESAELRMYPGMTSSMDENLYAEDIIHGDSHSREMMGDIAKEEDKEVKDFAEYTHSVPQNDVFHYVNIMKNYAEKRDLQKGRRVHADLIEHGLHHANVIVGNTLINMYAKCGDLQNAQNVFDKLPARTIASWNVLIARYVQDGHEEKALYYFERMQLEEFYPNAITFTCMLKACGSLHDSVRGQEIHAQIVRDGLLEINIHVGTALVDMYAKCDFLSKAREVFDKLPDRNVVSWTALIIGYVQYDHGEEALRCFEQMQLEGFSPDEFTFACVLKACCSTKNVVKGQEIHAWVAKEHLLEKNVVIASTLVYMYAKCGELEQAQEVFDSLPVRDKISWTALITGYALHGYGEEAWTCYEQMLLDGFFPNEITFAGVLKACTSLGALDKGQEIHAQIIREGFLDKDSHIGTVLVDMYGKCGLTAIAEEVFENLVVWDVTTWTAIIAAFAQREQADEAFDYFKRMQLQGIYPDAVTFSCIVTACGSVAAINKGKRLHIEVVKLGLVEEDMVVGTALVDMYVNCGMLLEAQDVFDKLEIRDVVCWSALMGGFAQLGKEEAVFKLIDDMIMEGEDPNAATFTIVLNTCSHRGLTDKGQMYFEILSKDYDMNPNIEQHTCMVDLFGRAGQLDEAVAMILEMPTCANLTLWTTLLSACRKWGNVNLGRWAFDHATQVDEQDASAYICMNNIYAAAGRQEDANKIEAMRIARQAWNLDEGVLTFMIE